MAEPLRPFGERGFLARFASADEAARWAEAVRNASWPGLLDVVTAYRTVAVLTDPPRADAIETLEARLQDLPIPEAAAFEPRRHRIPTLYDGADLPELAERFGRSVLEITEAHASVDYDVLAIGFRPGFPYLGGLPERLHGTSRRPNPRTKVPAGSVAIVGRQSCVYPVESPGGWHLIGRTPLVIADPAADFFPIRVGDRLRFEPIGLERFQSLTDHRLT